MKDEIHPQYGPVTVHCACGNTFETKSTYKGTIQVDICSGCHPFFTGRQKIMDTAGRIDRFKKKFSGAAQPKVKQPVGPKEPVFGQKLSLKDKLQAARDKALKQAQ